MTNPFKRFAPGDCFCHRCGRLLPQTSEFWVADRGRKCGYARPCRTCRREAHRHWMIAHPNYYQEYEAKHPGRLRDCEKRRRLKRAFAKNGKGV